MKKTWSEMTHMERDEFNRFRSSKEVDLDRCIEFLRSFGAYDHWADEIEQLRDCCRTQDATIEVYKIQIARMLTNIEKLRAVIKEAL
jgi:hypothetical protein